jgi:hypothetical protein
VWTVLVGCTTLTCVFSFAVFTDDDPVECGWVELTGRKWRSGAWQNSRGTNIDVLIVVLANGKDQTPE